MAAKPPDRTEEDHRRRELDVMRELEEQSGKRHPGDGEPGVRAAGETTGDSPPPEEPGAR